MEKKLNALRIYYGEELCKNKLEEGFKYYSIARKNISPYTPKIEWIWKKVEQDVHAEENKYGSPVGLCCSCYNHPPKF